jgi:hypothetical protein
VPLNFLFSVYNWQSDGYPGIVDPAKCGLTYMAMVHDIGSAPAAYSFLASKDGTGLIVVGPNEWAFSLARLITVDMLLDPIYRRPQSVSTMLFNSGISTCYPLMNNTATLLSPLR